MSLTREHDFQRDELLCRVAALLSFAAELDCPLVRFHLNRAAIVLALPSDRDVLAVDEAALMGAEDQSGRATSVAMPTGVG